MRKVAAVVAVVCLSVAASNAQQTYRLEPSPKTVVWGYYDAATPPVLRIKSGDRVEIQTLLSSAPERLEALGVKPAEIPQAVRDVHREVKRGLGGHILTGPIYVEGAEPGDVLQVGIEDVRVTLPYGVNGFRPGGRGLLVDDFPYARRKLIQFDTARNIAHFAPGIDIPLHPFFGSMGVAPPEGMHISSGPPGFHAGNLDNKYLVAGTTLYIPVHAPGALFQVGDGHAAQGDGEVDVAAIETGLIGTFRLVVRKDLHLRWPRAETPSHYITMGLHEDLTEATKMATREMIDFVVSTKGLTRDDAYMLCSVAGDLVITQVVDGTKGVHMMMPKNIFKGETER